jgi:hypothetical protein
MFTYLSVYVLAAILLFQGINLLGELEAPTGVVPPEVRPADAPGARWGGYLVACGLLLVLAGLLSHAFPWLAGFLAPLRALGLASLAVFGLWLIFGRKVDYIPAKPAGDGHGHGH